jgi:hypothetical protein
VHAWREKARIKLDKIGAVDFVTTESSLAHASYVHKGLFYFVMASFEREKREMHAAMSFS